MLATKTFENINRRYKAFYLENAMANVEMKAERLLSNITAETS